MVEYLKKLFGPDIRSSTYRLPKSTPLYLSKGYRVEKLVFGDSECILISPVEKGARLPVLKNHYRRFLDICALPCALHLDKLTSGQRQNLVSCRIPFVSEGQVYLPFWGSAFLVAMKAQTDVPQKMTPTTQLVFLGIYYRTLSDVRVNASRLAAELDVPKSSVSRAIGDLLEYGLVKVRTEGTNKWISLNGDPGMVMGEAVKVMRSPVGKVVYLGEKPKRLPYKLGNILALVENSLLAGNELDGAFVYDRETAQKFPKEVFISRRDYEDFGGVMAEVWRYNPGLLSAGTCVDDISLLLSLNDYDDERVQKELDVIRERHGIVGEEV